MISKYFLHDSMVEDIKYLHNEKKLTIEMELCNWKQASYEDSDPETTFGNLVFNGVKKFEIEQGSVSFDSDEILEAEVTQTSDDSDTEIIKMILRGSDDVKVIIIQACDVEWIISKNT